LVTALVLDVIVPAFFLFIKGGSDPLIVVIAIAAILAIFAFEKYFLSKSRSDYDKAADSSDDKQG
jgi:hypothetical protein